MENKNNKNKKYYYHNNKNHYNNKKNATNQVKTYNDIVNVRSDASEIESISLPSNNSLTLKIVAFATIVLAIVFGSLLLFHVL